jgi:hypothetical protein
MNIIPQFQLIFTLRPCLTPNDPPGILESSIQVQDGCN